MDLFKKANIIKATSFDFNVPKIVRLNDRSKVHKMLNRYSRRKLKQSLNIISREGDYHFYI